MTPVIVYVCYRHPPLIRLLRGLDLTQIWYADDASGWGGLADICKWFNCLHQSGHDFGYFVNAGKCCLVVAQYQ